MPPRPAFGAGKAFASLFLTLGGGGSLLARQDFYRWFKVGLDRIELSTSRLSGVRSNHLSYRPLTPSRREEGK